MSIKRGLLFIRRTSLREKCVLSFTYGGEVFFSKGEKIDFNFPLKGIFINTEDAENILLDDGFEKTRLICILNAGNRW